MRKSIPTLFIVILLATVTSFSQQAYFWTGKQKLILTADSTQTLLKIKKGGKEARTLMEEAARLKGVDNASELSIGGQPFILLKQAKGNKASLNVSDVEFQLPVFYGNGVPYYLNGDIIFRPKNGVAVDRIKRLAENGISQEGSTGQGTYFFKVVKGENVLDIANKIHESGLVEWCHPDFLAQIEKHLIPTDPTFGDQYYLNNTGQFGGTAGIDINAPEAWDITRGCNIRVAVIDDGVEDHNDLAGRVLQGFTVLNATGFGRPNAVCAGTNRVGHGMACTGIIAASHNTLGVAGIAPNALIYPINIFVGGETIAQLVTSINRAWDPAFGNADVISNSWGFNSTNNIPAIEQEIIDARTLGRVRNGVTRGCAVVFASGNWNPVAGCVGCFNGVSFPANVNGVITVGAIDNVGNIHGYSSRGGEMDLVAPSGGAAGTAQIGGCNIPTGNIRTIDRPGANGYDAGDFFNGFNGTSAAAPQVSGVVALMLSANPTLTETQVRTLLQQTATDMGSSGFDNTFGFGRLNAFTAVKAAINNAVLSGPTHICPSATFTVSNQPAGTTITWSSNSSGVTINSSGVASRVGSFNGTATITATLNGLCGVVTLTKTVTVGSPSAISSLTVRMGPPSGNQLCYGYNLGIAVGNSNQSAQSVTQYNWNFGSWASYFTDYDGLGVYTSVAMLTVNSSAAPSQSISVTAQNACGISAPYSKTFYASSCGSLSVAYPNPTSDILSLSFDDAPVALPRQISLYSEKTQKVVYTISHEKLTTNFSNEKTLNIPVNTYPRGIYYLRVENSDRKTDQIRIVLK
ncbi:S8 family serine peptidase [Ohtaekwangia koreensis]|uniref:Por secretion system C-terminal sorting domain-containing protein n=1 Tax=Ohtaekwangia koreensis TaxID=688867 RepID=A0A1T5JRA4_9BACT|nr:S8 family serine peptidase [Ohtaekwangia koreensis]SKC53940.1 Por secretion system C-terminal sorting domain-containing protein [Ohtaekwangia koreensis]